MTERFRTHAVGATFGVLAVMTAGCGSPSGPSPSGASSGFSAGGTIEIAPAGAIVGTSVTLISRLASDPTGSPLTFAWDFGDGATATGEATTHLYATAGDFFPKVTVSSSEGSWATATVTIRVKSLTARWSGEVDTVPGGVFRGGEGRVSITQDGLDLTGTYQDQGSLKGTISPTGTVTFTVTRAGFAPFTFTGTAGPDVETLVGGASGPDVGNERWSLRRN